LASATAVASGRHLGFFFAATRAPICPRFTEADVAFVVALKEALSAERHAGSWTSVQINMDLRCKIHTDMSCEGPSFFIALGPFQGGQLVECCATGIGVCSNHKVVVQDARNPHYTLPFAGKRVAIVAYTHCASRAVGVEGLRREARRSGIPCAGVAPSEIIEKRI
jgi:hypothetical protein